MSFTEAEKHENPRMRPAVPKSLTFLKSTILFHASVPSEILSSALENLTSSFHCFEGTVLYLITPLDVRSQRVQSPRLPTSDTNCKIRQFPKPSSGLIIHQKEAQNSLEAIILTVYCREMTQITISQGKKHKRQSPRKVANTELLFSPRAVRTHCYPGINVQQYALSIVHQGNLLKPWCQSFLLGFHYIDLID